MHVRRIEVGAQEVGLGINHQDMRMLHDTRKSLLFKTAR